MISDHYNLLLFLFFRVLKLENILGSMRPGADSKEKVTQYI